MQIYGQVGSLENEKENRAKRRHWQDRRFRQRSRGRDLYSMCSDDPEPPRNNEAASDDRTDNTNNAKEPS